MYETISAADVRGDADARAGFVLDDASGRS
jgi:hypothetical protein